MRKPLFFFFFMKTVLLEKKESSSKDPACSSSLGSNKSSWCHFLQRYVIKLVSEGQDKHTGTDVLQTNCLYHAGGEIF